MKGIHIGDDLKRLYFTNYDRRPDEEEFEEVVSILKRNNCKFIETKMGPDCDLLSCTVNDIEFHVIRTIDGDGTFLYCDNPEGMVILEEMFRGDTDA